jgi:hypothetical protein
MGNRRMTRLTNAFSKKAENHAHMMAIYFMHYNFVRIHQTLKVTPAMAAGVTDKLWEMADMVAVLEKWWSNDAMNIIIRVVNRTCRIFLEVNGYWVRHSAILPFGLDYQFDH